MSNAHVMFWRTDDLVLEVMNFLEVQDALALASVSPTAIPASFYRPLIEGTVVSSDNRRAHVCEHI
jgi:hypothetical protein